MIAAVAALTLVVVAAVGMAATLAPGPNGCPTNKSLKTAPIADLAPPARTQIEAFDVLSGPINEQTQTFTLKVRVGSTCSVNIKGASVYVTAVPYNQFTIPDEELTGDDGTATLVFRRDANFPASSKQQQLTLFIRATKPGEDPLAGVSTTTARRGQLRGLSPLRTAAPEPPRGAADARWSQSPGCRVSSRSDNKDVAASRRNRVLPAADYSIYQREAAMNSRSMAGWIGFAGILMVLLGGLSVFEGLIALLEDNYYVVTPSGYLLFDVTGWGWIMLIWGVVLALVGLALLNGASWARWVSIVLVSINVFGQLGFLGNTNDTVWLLITLTLNIIILYALIVRWHESQRELQTR